MSKKRIGIMGAMPAELKPLSQALKKRRRTSYGWSGELGKTHVELVVTGDGSDAASEGAESFLDDVEVDAVLVFGVSGGLDPNLEIGALVLAHHVADADGRFHPHEEGPPADPLVADLPDEPVVGPVWTNDRIVIDSDEKSDLWAKTKNLEGATVDLESSHYVRAAVERDLPWLVLRAVLDTADESLPIDINRFRDPGGSIRQGAIARHVALRPTLAARLVEYQRRLGRIAEGAVPTLDELVTRVGEGKSEKGSPGKKPTKASRSRRSSR